MKMRKLPIGISDFKDIITGDYFYVDKTLFIKELIDRGDSVLLFPRPRRFGKTLILSMLRYFYDCCPSSLDEIPELYSSKTKTSPTTNYNYLFDSLAISKAGREYTDKMGKHPVIYISFRTIYQNNWESCRYKLKRLIQAVYAKHDYLLESPTMKPYEIKYFQQILDLKGELSDYNSSLENLLVFLTRHYRKRGVILIDEYDTPFCAGSVYGYYKDICNFMFTFLGSGLKDTDQYLEKGVIVGIIPIAVESDLNNLGVYSLLSEDFQDYFGFTEPEVKTMLEDFNISEMFDQVQSWYNGYLFGNNVIYNPWSIINFLRSKKKELIPYWINTSDNKVVESLLSRGGKELREELEQLIRGESIEKAVNENIILKDIEIDEDLLWSFLLMSGYLKQVFTRQDDFSGNRFYALSIPNKEVISTYIGLINRYFTNSIGNKKTEIMLKALIEGNIQLFEEILKEIVLKVFSFHDLSGEPEKVYHALVIGLLVWISGTHEIKSNRESGYGRYDIMIIPHDPSEIGYIIEFKTVRQAISETVEIAVEKALKQIEEKKYETELIDKGIKTIKKLAIVFNGKEVYVKEGK